MMQTSIKRKRRQGGNSIVEVALLSPWIFFLFVGIFDMGFYTYAVICTQNAARAAATQTAAAASAGLQSNLTACAGAWDELKGLPNVAGITTPDCTKLPVIVTQTTLCTQLTVQPPTIACTGGPCADCNNATDPLGRAASSRVAVQYESRPLVPIPGILTWQMTITRIAEMRIIAE
jgi:Flp pilus assembly protein TadG